MLEIHLPTVFAFSAILGAFLGLATLWLWTRDRQEPALASWGCARLLAGMGTVLLGLRGEAPAWVSIDLANALLCLGYGLHWSGARQFEGRKPIIWLMLLGTVLWLAANQVPAFHQNFDMRVAFMGSMLLLYNGLALVELVRGQRAQPLPTRPILIVLLATVMVIYLVLAIITAATTPPPANNQLPPRFWFATLVILNVVFLAGSTLLLVALSKEKAQLRATSALAAARDAAEYASQHKTRFLSRMSHELRTALNGVLGLAQALAHDPSLGAAQRRQAETLERAGQHLLSILNEVLDISRIEAGRFVAIPQSLRLDDVLRGTLALVQDAAVAKGVALRLDLDPDLPPRVLVDGLRLRQILMNLLINAIRYTPEGGTVTLAASRQGLRLAFAVTDTGIGVPAELRPRLFEEFSQAVDADARSGSGLGLAISAALARAMGGSLGHADGPGGQGSRFTLLLPLRAAQPEPAAAPAEAAGTEATPGSGGRHILVVDDIAANRLVAAALLGPAGYRVTEAASGQAALDMLRQGPLPDLVLMDENMPGMDGSVAVRHIRAMPGPVASLPILALTADALPAQVQAMLAAGFDGHLAKPVERGVLISAVARAMRQRIAPVGE